MTTQTLELGGARMKISRSRSGVNIDDKEKRKKSTMRTALIVQGGVMWKKRMRQTAHIELPVGRFLVDCTGVTAELSPLFPCKLSRHYPWRFVPRGIAMMMLVIYGETFTFDMAVSKLSCAERDMLEAACGDFRWTNDGGRYLLEHDSDLVESIFRLADSSAVLARSCPSKSIAYDLEQLVKWNSDELNSYVMGKSVN